MSKAGVADQQGSFLANRELFAGRTAVITGVGHGFGRQMMIEFAARGASVFGCDHKQDECQETLRVIEEQVRERKTNRPPLSPASTTKTGAQADPVIDVEQVDVTSEEQVAGWIERVAAASPQGRIDIVVNNAGGVVGQVNRPVEEVTEEQWHAIFRVNLDGAFHVVKAVAPLMKEQRYGRIINISSGAGRGVSLTGIQAYASAKAGQIGFTRQMAYELGPYGITVNNIAPGFVISNPSTAKQWEAMGEDGQQSVIDGTALKSLGTPEDIAYGALYLASDFARWVSGQVISIDGGSHMGH